MTWSSSFFWRGFVFLVKFSYWSKFHANIITGCGFMTIYFYKRLIRKPEIGNTPVWVLPNIWTLGRVRDTKFGKDDPNEMLLYASKCQGYSFYQIRVKVAGLLKYVWTFCYHQALKKGLNTWLIKLISKDAMSSSKFSHICLHYY